MPKSLAVAGALILLLVGCAAPAAGPAAGTTANDKFAGPKRIEAAIMYAPAGFGIAERAPIPGKGELAELVHVGLTNTDPAGNRFPLLVETVPTVENGLWKVLPDGRMETSWILKPGVQWHDGVPLGLEDLLFAAEVEQDKELAISTAPGYAFIERIEPVDVRTIKVTWKQPYLDADAMFSHARQGFAAPLPKHILEKTFTENKANFLGDSFWSQDFVGLGPFKVREWVRDSHVLLAANDRYVPGRPKVDEIKVNFIPDTNTMIANILAGRVELTMTRGISYEQGRQLQERWTDGRIGTGLGNPMVLFPKTANANPPVVTNPVFRKAMMYATDRQEMVDTFLGGLAPLADPVLRMSEIDLKAVESNIVRYPHDPRQATSLLSELGYNKAADGSFADSAGQRLSVELHTDTSNDIHLRAQSAIQGYWSRLGVGVDTVVIPPQQQSDRSWQTLFNSFSVRRNPLNVSTLTGYFQSASIPRPENNFRGQNYTAYDNPEMNALIDRYSMTIPRGERMEVLGRIIHQITDQVVVLGLFYDIEVTAIGSRIKGVAGRNADAQETWNAQDWDVQ